MFNIQRYTIHTSTSCVHCLQYYNHVHVRVYTHVPHLHVGTCDYIKRPVDQNMFEAVSTFIHAGVEHTFYPVEFQHAADAFLQNVMGITQKNISFLNCRDVLCTLVNFVDST